MTMRRFLCYTVALLLLVPTQGCLLHRLGQVSKDWFVCSVCESKEKCCELLSTHNQVDHKSCDTMLATVLPNNGNMYSLYTDIKRPSPKNGPPQLPAIVWENLNATGSWKLSAKNPFRDTGALVHKTVSTISADGGMHRTWDHVMAPLEPKTEVTLLLFLTEHVFLDIDDMVGGVKGGSIVSIQSSETISVEQPAFDSPQHVVTIKLKVDEPEIRLAIKLHLRYLEPGINATTTIQVPHSILWNSQGATPYPIIMENVPTGSKGDLWIVIAVTIFCSLVGSYLLFKDLLRVCQWK
jgi:hypothetical protein